MKSHDLHGVSRTEAWCACLSSIRMQRVHTFACLSAEQLACLAGIENDIKIWSPTAEAAQSLPHEAHEVMQRNMRAQGQTFSRQMMLSPAALRRLLRYRNNPDPVER